MIRIMSVRYCTVFFLNATVANILEGNRINLERSKQFQTSKYDKKKRTCLSNRPTDTSFA